MHTPPVAPAVHVAQLLAQYAQVPAKWLRTSPTTRGIVTKTEARQNQNQNRYSPQGWPAKNKRARLESSSSMLNPQLENQNNAHRHYCTARSDTPPRS